jgi:cellobiose phosphorylase
LATKGETLIFGPTSKSQRIACYKLWNKINIEIFSNFKGVKSFWKNLINSIKVHLPMLDLNIILYWHTCIQIFEVPLQVGIGA